MAQWNVSNTFLGLRAHRLSCTDVWLLPAAWKVIEEGQDEDDFSSDEEEWSQDDF